MKATSSQTKKSNARLWWIIHQWVGLKLSILMSFVLLTGTLAVFSHEIDWLINPHMRVDRSTVEEDINWTGMASAVAQYAPNSKILSLAAPIDRGFSASSVIMTANGRYVRLYIHPRSGEVLGEASGINVESALRHLHRNLFLPTRPGMLIVSSLSFLLAVSLATSFVVYKKWWRGFFKPIRMRDARTMFGDLHRLAGLWALWFTLLMTLTGFWYLIETLGFDAPPKPHLWKAGVETTAHESAAALPAVLAAARNAHPELRIKNIQFASKGSDFFIFQGQYKAALVGPSANRVWVTAETGTAELITDGRDMNIHQRIAEMADPLHYGGFGGVWTKIIWFVFGLFMTFLSVSGVAIYALRLLRAERRAPNTRNLTGAFLRGASFYAWPTLALVLLSFILLIRAIF